MQSQKSLTETAQLKNAPLPLGDTVNKNSVLDEGQATCHRRLRLCSDALSVFHGARHAPIPASSDADRPARAAWAALRLLVDVAISF